MHSLYELIADKISTHFKIDARYFMSGGFWLTVNQLAGIIFGVLTTSLLAYWLTENEYGIYRYMIGVAVIISALSLTGLGQSILQTAAKKYFSFYQQTLRANLLSNLAVLAVALGASIYYWLNENITLAIGCALIAFIQPLTNTYKFIPSYLLGSKRFKENTILQTIKTVFISTTVVTVLLLTKQVLFVFFAYMATNLISNLVSYWYFRPKKKLSLPTNIKQKYLSYAKHTSVRNLLSNVSTKLDTVILFTQLGAIELAIYSIAMQIPERVKGSFRNLASLILPKYAQRSDPEIIKKNIPKRSLQMFILLLSITVIFILIIPYIYELLFPKYPEAILYSQIIALSFPAFILLIPYSFLQSRLADKVLYKLTLISSLINIILIILLTLMFGILGAIIARILYRYTFCFSAYYLLYKK